jgi:RNA recognition motif-containing protein
LTAASSAPRGPPRKPKQSGHALWVGNLPPATSVIDLKDHFSRDATRDIESVFLIAKSNCAFVNYKSEEACAAAVTRFHDSRFHGVRLVCRLRKGVTVPGSSQPPPASSPNPNLNFTAPEAADGDGTASPTRKRPRVPERFFIVKSLTVEDLEGSRQSGVWATQTHNEVTLNEAYEVSFVFSHTFPCPGY